MDTKDIYASVEELNSGNSPVLITTDYFARIINLNNIELIINYDFPIRPKSYAKRYQNIWKVIWI
jgi:translation initiation factor 4A